MIAIILSVLMGVATYAIMAVVGLISGWTLIGIYFIYNVPTGVYLFSINADLDKTDKKDRSFTFDYLVLVICLLYVLVAPLFWCLFIRGYLFKLCKDIDDSLGPM